MDEELQPRCLSIVLCDQVIEDKRTNKKSLIGTFNDIYAAQVPAKHPCMFLMLSLTNCRHPFEIALEVLRDTDRGGERLLSLKGPVPGKNPLAVLDLVFEMHGIALPAFGQYTIDATLQPEGLRLAQRSFYVREMPKPPAPEGDQPQP